MSGLDLGRFGAADAWQRAMRDRWLPPLYRQLLASWEFKDDRECQVGIGIDTIGIDRDGVVVGIEEKIVQWPGYRYTALSIETEDQRGKPVWARTSEADWLVWVFELAPGAGFEANVFDWQRLKAWFWAHEESFKRYGPLKVPPYTSGRVVPLEAIAAAGIKRDVHLLAEERVRQVKITFNGTEAELQNVLSILEEARSQNDTRGQQGPLSEGVL